jgi:hypothetical protein
MPGNISKYMPSVMTAMGLHNRGQKKNGLKSVLVSLIVMVLLDCNTTVPKYR